MVEIKPKPKPSADAALKTNEKKWTKPVMDAGWVAVPNVIIERQAALGLDALDVNILIHLMSYWWTPENVPHPSIGTMAKAIQVSERTIQRRLRRLEKAELIGIEARKHATNGNATNLYRFTGLIKAVRPFADEKVASIEAAEAAKADRAKRKRPLKPTLVIDNA